MGKYKIELVTMTDCNQFVEAVSRVKGKVALEDGRGYRVSAKSFIGALAATEWDNLYCISDTDIYTTIKKWIKDNN